MTNGKAVYLTGRFNPCEDTIQAFVKVQTKAEDLHLIMLCPRIFKEEVVVQGLPPTPHKVRPSIALSSGRVRQDLEAILRIDSG